MERDFRYLRDKHTDEGARSIFEKICTQLLHARHGEVAHNIRVSQGDGGIDILVGDLNNPIENYQCKYFVDGIADSQKAQIRESFKTAINSTEYKMKQWILCVPCEMSAKEFSWWSEWKGKTEKLHNIIISLYDGSYLISQLKRYDLFDTLFDNDTRQKLDQILSYFNSQKQHIYGEIILLLDEIGKQKYDDMIFVKKLENANIILIDGCKRDFFNAEFTEQIIKSKGDESELRIFNNLKIKIYGFWETQYRRYQHDTDGNELLTRTYERIEDADTSSLQSLHEISLLAKKGILHQWAEECNVGWLKDYEQKLKQYLSEERNNGDE